jgi:hypothetical protein
MNESNARVLQPWRRLYPLTVWQYNSRVRQLNDYIVAILRRRRDQHEAGERGVKGGDILDRVISAVLVRRAGHYRYHTAAQRGCSVAGRLAGAVPGRAGPPLPLLQERGEPWDASVETQLCFEVKTFLLAGHETSAAMLCWSVYELSRAPACLAAVRKEAQAVYGKGKGDEATPSREQVRRPRRPCALSVAAPCSHPACLSVARPCTSGHGPGCRLPWLPSRRGPPTPAAHPPAPPCPAPRWKAWSTR